MATITLDQWVHASPAARSEYLAEGYELDEGSRLVLRDAQAWKDAGATISDYDMIRYWKARKA